MNKIFTIEEIRKIIHKELANFVSLGRSSRNQAAHKQILIRYGTEVLLKLMAEFENELKIEV